MESKITRLSPYVIAEIENFGKEVDANTFDAAARHVVSELKKCREIAKIRNEQDFK